MTRLRSARRWSCPGRAAGRAACRMRNSRASASSSPGGSHRFSLRRRAACAGWRRPPDVRDQVVDLALGDLDALPLRGDGHQSAASTWNSTWALSSASVDGTWAPSLFGCAIAASASASTWRLGHPVLGRRRRPSRPAAGRSAVRASTPTAATGTSGQQAPARCGCGSAGHGRFPVRSQPGSSHSIASTTPRPRPAAPRRAAAGPPTRAVVGRGTRIVRTAGLTSVPG